MVSTRFREGRPLMVDVGDKAPSSREAAPEAIVVLPLDATEVDAVREGDEVRITAWCRTHARTGVEMEDLTAASVAELTVYDMLKGRSKGIVIESIRLLSKEGGVSGSWSA